MSKKPVPLQVDDLSAFTRALSRQLGDASPAHLTLLNMVARSAGFQNAQHMRAATTATRRPNPPLDSPPTDVRAVERSLRQFDAEGRLQQWPTRRAVQTLALWGLWAVLPAATELSEKDINRVLEGEHLFGDPATLRRTLIACGLLTRETDGSRYRRVEQAPSAEARAVMRSLRDRRRQRAQVHTDAPSAAPATR
ncbi:MAG: DUF2087 domain-containing protein [Pseudomonadota bacterium]